MQKFNSKLKHKGKKQLSPYKSRHVRGNLKPAFTRSKFKKFRLVYTGLDRLHRSQRHALRSVPQQTAVRANSALAHQSFRFVGPNGVARTLRKAVVYRNSVARFRSHRNDAQKFLEFYTTASRNKHQRAIYAVGQKYRIKLLEAHQRPQRPSFLSYRNLLRRLRASRRTASARRRRIMYVRAQNAKRALVLKRAFALWSFQSVRPLRRRVSQRKYRNQRTKKALLRFLRKHNVRTKKIRLSRTTKTASTVGLTSSYAARLHVVRLRRVRSGGRKLATKLIARRWWRRPLQSRRRRSRRFFAGLFGQKRWRLERRDKFSLKRAQYRLNVATAALPRVIDAGSYLQKVALRRQRELFVAKRNSTRSGAGSAYLRRVLRQLVRRQKSFSGILNKKPLQTNFRLDAWSKRYRLALVAPARRTLRLTAARPQSLLPLLLRTKRFSVKPASSRKFFAARRKTRRWYNAQMVQKARIQRQLRNGVFFAKNSSLGQSVHAQTVVQRILTRRGTSAARRAIPSRNALRASVLVAADFAPAASTANSTRAVRTPRTVLTRTRSSKKLFKPSTRVFGFLDRAVGVAASPRHVAQHLESKAALDYADKHYKELQFYHSRPKMRLPQTQVTRRRRRRAGLTTFTRNSLQPAHTVLGQVRLLLPPTTSYNRALTQRTVGFVPTTRSLMVYKRRPNALPIFWKSAHSRANILALSRVRRRRYAKSKGLLRRLNKKVKLFLKNAPVHKDSTVVQFTPKRTSNLAQQKVNLQLGLRAATFARRLLTVPAPKQVVRFYRSRRSEAERGHFTRPALGEIRRTLRKKTPALSRLAKVRRLTSTKGSTLRKSHGLWQTRSVRAMLSAERSISAWAPQLSAQNRRQHYPRVNGVPMARRRLGFRAKRERRLANMRRLERGVPQIRYIDYTPVKLQYFYGSAGSAGYLRFRRVHRMHSEHSRWWRSGKQPVPFAHPYSRRDLNATRYSKLKFSKARAARISELPRIVRDTSGISLHSKFPPRTIPWRNFHYPKPRRGAAPKMLQRWTFVTLTGKTGRAAPMRDEIIAARSVREIRELHRFVSSRGVWKNQRWGLLDQATLSSASAVCVREAISKIPASTWHVLRRKSVSNTAYSAVRSRILNRLRAWIAKRQQHTPVLSSSVAARAQLFLITLLQKELSRAGSIGNLVGAAQHQVLRANAFSTKVARKAVQYLKLRELPGIGATLAPKTLLARENSRMYKRWLGGVESALKRSQLGYIPTARSRYSDNVATIFGRRRLRFPASGRRDGSYDSLLHAFSKKISPARLRRASNLRFVRAVPDLSNDYRENLVTFTPLFGALRRRRTANQLSTSTYLSAPWRELLEYRTARNLPVSNLRTSAKRRFLSLPARTVFVEKQRQKRALLSPYKQPMYAVHVGILRRALRRRREERAFIDLRQFVLNRRLPRERLSQPRPSDFALQRAAAKKGPYARVPARNRVAIPSAWTLKHLSAVGARQERMLRAPLAPILPYGEIVSIKNYTLQRERAAVRGFVLPTRERKTQELRRQNRDTATRARRAKRATRDSRRAAIRNTRHWSEKRDQRVRNTTYSRKKHWFARLVSAKLYSRAAARTGVSSTMSRLFRANAGLRRAAFAVGAKGLISPTSTTRRFLPTARTLLRKSSLHRRPRVLQLDQISHFNSLRVRSLGFWGRVSRKLKFDNALFTFREQVTNSIPKRLVSTVTVFPAATPLCFQDIAVHVVKTAAVKEQEALAKIAAKEDAYKITAQYVESVTSFIPELMNYMLSKKVENKQVSYNTAQHMVRNIYWSLRVYLNVDPFDTRFFLRDKTPAARLRIFEDVSDLAKAQKTLQPQRAALRYRFQPGRLLRAPSTKRFRGDWLRAFFPAKHALYQENPEDYGHFLFATDRIRRLRIGSRGMDSWITTGQLVGHETRARQLLTLRCSRRRTRFETLLQTTRRTPATEEAPWVGSDVRSAFFARPFSTYSKRGLALTSRWIHRNKRFISLEEGWRTLAPAAQIIARNRVLSHLEARGRSSYINTPWKALTTTLLDPRFTRLKSPRSRQYLIRATQRTIRSFKQAKAGDLVAYRELMARRVPHLSKNTFRWTRGARKYAALALMPRAKRAQLAVVRSKYISRRAQDALSARLTRTTSPASARSILHQRTARARTKAVFHSKPLALLSGAIFANTNFKRLQGKRGRSVADAARKAQARLAYKPKWTIFPRKLRVTETNVRSNLFRRRTIGKQQKRFSDYFAPDFGRQLLRRHDFARLCGLHTRLRRQVPFELHRPRLWDQLTLRWMKKHRIGRYWLRDTSRWLRDPWLSEIVAPDVSLRRDRFGGELRSRSQQVGEYVAEVDEFGRDIPRKNAPRERHKFQKIMPVVPVNKDPEVKKTDLVLKRGPLSSKVVARHRLEIARQALRKPAPTMRLANYEYRDVIREHKSEKAKSAKQKEEEEQARVNAYWARKAKKLPPIRPRRLPLKHPANLWLPHIIWKEIQRRIRKFEWRESDEVFFRRGFQNAFQFYASERRKTGWLEHLMYTRATYSTRLREFRRRQFPHEQKKFKWLQRVRRMLYPARRARYLRRKRQWAKLRCYNQKLHYSLFNLRDRGAARRHFKKRNGRTRPAVSAFVSMSTGLTDRLDVTCLKMGFAPTIYWARIVSEFGLLRVNGATVYDPSYQLKPADIIYPNWDTVARFQHYFMPQMRARMAQQYRTKDSTAFYPTNMEYHRGTRAIIYKHAPDDSDLRKSSRIRPAYFRWFKLESI